MSGDLKNIVKDGYMLTNHRTHCRRGVMWLGQTCNLRCKFCYFSDRIGNNQHPEHAFMSLEKAKGICKALVDEYGNNSIDIQGGEPTIYPEIYELICYCAEIGLKPTLITNALILDKIEICHKLKDAGVFDLLISIHALGAPYNEVVQVPGASARQMKALNNIKLVGIPFRVNAVLSHEAIPQLMEIAQLSQQKGARVVNFIAFNPFIDQADGAKRSAENVPRYANAAGELLPIIDFLDQHQIEVNVRYLPFCVFPEKYRKFVQNFQQIAYDLHEWESASEVWSGAGPQRHSKESLSPPVRFYNRIAQIRETRFHGKLEQQGNSAAVERLLDELQVRLDTSAKEQLKIAFFGNAGIGQQLSDILDKHPFWRTRWEMYGYISSKDYHKADTLNGAPWYCDEQLGIKPPDVIITTSDTFMDRIHSIIEQCGMSDKTLDYFSGHIQMEHYQPLFYFKELGEVDGFTELDYAYKEYRTWKAKEMHPYTKGEKCDQCSLVGICDGFHRDYAEIFGFDEATSIKLQEQVYDPRYYMADQLKVVEEEEYNWALSSNISSCPK